MATRRARASSTGSAADFLPSRLTLPALREASRKCRGCELYKCGTQTVFGEGARHARVMLVGEQPGDQEDRAGKPFVGPSGALLDAALEAVGIDRGEAYVTNAVKHFKWERREGTKRRIHKTPSDREVAACHPWLAAELAVVRPEVVVCLGATAAKSLLGKDFRVTKSRGKAIESDVGTVVATVHPSAVLRARPQDRRQAERDFVGDLRAAAKLLGVKPDRRAELELPLMRAVEPELATAAPAAKSPSKRRRKAPESRRQA